MTETAPLLLQAAGSDDADFYFAAHMAVEQALYLRFPDGEDWLVVARLELERAQAEGRAVHVVDRAELGWDETRGLYGGWSDLAAGLLERRGATALRVSPRLAAAHYTALLDRGLDLTIDQDLFVAERRRKSLEEQAAIEVAQQAAEAACAEVVRMLAAADVGPGGTLRLEGRELTSEALMARAQTVLTERGHSAAEMIVAGSPGCAVPHFQGAGPIVGGAPVIIDIFPRGSRSRYHGDLTRTVVPGASGGIPDQFRRQHAACVSVLESAIAGIRAGVDGRDVHREACASLVERGYGTTTEGFEGDAEGARMTHSLGHGVGLDVHEPPYLGLLAYPLQEGDVVTVEPGLYKMGLGGVRVEDTGVVTAGGFRNLTRLTRSLDPRDYV
ncbi:MAG: M24 family metallopeptidase [Candidatus Dormibacteraeota bacterium]|nr:M24 family metallopeptidase [Candidatus Dormibacteraeota bacterium]